MLRKFLKQIFHKLSNKIYLDQIISQHEIHRVELGHLYQQVFLNNPILIVQNVKIYLPLFYVDHIQKIIFQTRSFYEIETLEFLRLHFKQFECVVDIGSNIGNHLIFYCSQLHAKKVYCFEPNTFNLEILKKNIEINYLQKRVDIHPYALGSFNGKGMQSEFSLSNTGMNRISSLIKHPGADQIEIKTLDELNFPQIDFIKIDVEGYEIEVLMGAIETLKKFRPVFMIEVFDSNIEKVNNLMVDHNYKLLITLEGHNAIYIPIL